jgi:hypothetical protein
MPTRRCRRHELIALALGLALGGGSSWSAGSNPNAPHSLRSDPKSRWRAVRHRATGVQWGRPQTQDGHASRCGGSRSLGAGLRRAGRGDGLWPTRIIDSNNGGGFGPRRHFVAINSERASFRAVVAVLPRRGWRQLLLLLSPESGRRSRAEYQPGPWNSCRC